MSIPGSASPLFFQTAAAAADTGYKIDRSVRLNDGDSAYFNRTPSSAGNRRTFTWSGWVKRASFSGDQQLIYAAPSSSDTSHIRFSGEQLHVFEYTTGFVWQIKTTRVFRDPSAWYHIVVGVDTTQSTASDRVKIYVNGVQETDFSSSSYPSQNAETEFNNNVAHTIGRNNGGSNNYLDGYLAEVHWIDGQQLAASDFGEYDDNNVWQPKEFAGAYDGTVYSNQTITNENPSYTTDKMFDGAFGSSASLDNSVIANETDGTYSVYTFANAISYSSSVRIFADLDTRSTDPDIKANNTSITGFTDNTRTGEANKKWYTVLSGSGTLSTVSLNQHGGYVAAIFAIEVDGTVLVDGGVNSFHLDFSDNSTAAALGNDDSGLDNDFTVNNFSVASGAGNDSLIDTPTNYTSASGNNGGNYATLNPLDFSSSGSPTLKNGNLDAEAGSGWQTVAATIGNLTSGKWYWEVKLGGGSGHRTGLSSVSRSNASDSQLLGTGDICLNSSDGRVYVDGTEVGTGAGNLSGKTVGIALNLEANSVSFYQNNSLVHTVSSLSSTASWTPVHATRYSVVDNLNFGQRPFAYTPPTDHVSVCTTNLPDPTIADGSTAMNVKTWSGDSTERAITGYNFSPDFVWIKTRSTSDEHVLSDIVRGAGKVMSSSATNRESDFADPGYWGYVKSFDSDGYTLDNGAGGYHRVNLSGRTYVGWAWDAGSSTASNTDGDITSNVRANQTAGFSIVTHTGNGTNPSSVGHGLNSAPVFYITKSRDSSTDWVVSTTVADGTHDFLDLNNTQSIGAFDAGIPTSSVFYVSGSTTNASGDNYVTYCWAPVEGYSAFGTYEGNGNASGPFVYTGMRTKWLLLKNADQGAGGYDWVLYDTERDTYNTGYQFLCPNSTNKELRRGNDSADKTDRYIDILSNGFRIRNSNANYNGNGDTHIWAAFAEHPFKTARAR